MDVKSRSVTQKEYMLPEGLTIVSRTDLHGNITEANEAFIEASGYDWLELVGQPHNILRHPDVPAAVFKDFWNTIQTGRPWSQIVKNRRKNGDHYWVVANATPMFENDEIVGYMSVRTPASREQVAQAEQAYKDIAAGKLKLSGGSPVTLGTRFNPFNQFEASRLIMLFSILLFITANMPLLNLGVPPLLSEGISALFIVAIFLIAWVNDRKFKEVHHLLTEISGGHFNSPIQVSGRNLVNRILGRVKSMQIRLGADFDDVNASLNNAKRIESALNAASSNIMVADRFRSIIFMNESVKRMLKQAEPELQKALPHFDADNLLRQSIDIFHQNPAHQANLLDNLTETYEARINVGDATIDLVVDPIFNEKHERIGTVAEWKNITEQLAIEENIEHLVSNASLGILKDRIDASKLEGFNHQLSLSINTLLDSFSALVQDLSRILCLMSNGDLTSRMEGEYKGEVHAMQVAINNALTNIEATFGQVKIGSTEIGQMSNEVSQASEDLSERTQSQAASLEQTAASMEQITSRVQQSTDNTHEANRLSSEAATEAKSGIQVMEQTSKAMHGISELSSQIADITTVIDGIAFQTNLLALNASVEAARAGEHGRGFAVVASEVRNLAQKSAESSKEISNLIGTATEQISQGTSLVEETNRMFEDMVNKIEQVSGLVDSVSKAATEQSKGLGQINIAVNSLDEMTQQNAALVEELAATAGNMSEQAEMQAEFVGKFKISERSASGQGGRKATFELEDAKNKHRAWNVRLERFLLGEKVDFDEHSARRDDLCPLGQWLNTVGRQYQSVPEMQQLIRTHTEMHSMVGKVIDAKKLGDDDTMQQYRKTVSELSEQLLVEMDALCEAITGEQNNPALPKQTPQTISANQSAKAEAPSQSDEWSDF